VSILDIIEAATPGPWERGDHWWIQGADQCQCHDNFGPLVYKGRMNINGRMMEAHVHRMPEPTITDGITTAWLDERTHEPHSVVIETDEYGLMDDADARFIATFDPEHVALMEAERVAAREFITDRASGVGFAVRKYDAWVDACKATDRYRKERGL